MCFTYHVYFATVLQYIGLSEIWISMSLPHPTKTIININTGILTAHYNVISEN